MSERESALEVVTQRIAGLRTAKDIDSLTGGSLRLMGYLEALEDQGLLSESEVRELNDAADKATDERAAELVAAARQGK